MANNKMKLFVKTHRGANGQIISRTQELVPVEGAEDSNALRPGVRAKAGARPNPT